MSELLLHISQIFIILYSSLFLAEKIDISPSLSHDVRPRIRLHLFLVCNVGPQTLTLLFYCEALYMHARRLKREMLRSVRKQLIMQLTRSFCAATIKKYITGPNNIMLYKKYTGTQITKNGLYLKSLQHNSTYFCLLNTNINL